MSERRFVIIPFDEVRELGLPAITESELKRRLRKALPGLTDEMANKIIDNLFLYGEGKEEPCYICHKVGGHEPFCSRSPQPDPWEMWVEEMPYFTEDDDDVCSRDNWKNWFLMMPRGK